MLASESMDDFKEVSESEKTAIEASDAQWVSPPESFIDLWNEACGNYGAYNAETGFFELNGLADITYKQAVAIYTAGKVISPSTPLYYSGMDNIRTNLPRLGTGVIDGASTFHTCHNIEVINARNITIGVTMFYGLLKCHTILYLDSLNKDIIVQGTYPKTLVNLISAIKGKYPNLNFSACPLISYESVRSWIENKAESVMDITHTITVHPDVYAKLTDENNTKWHELLELATNKNIQFATI